MKKNKFLKFLLTSFLGISSIGAISTITSSCGSKKRVESVSLKKNTLTIQVDATERLIATVFPENATDKSVTWISSNKNVATVNNNGLLKGISVGTATITVTTNDGQKEDKCEVNVINSYLTISANEESTFELVNNGDNNPNLQYSYDKGKTWTNYSTQINIPKDTNLYLKGNNPQGWSISSNIYSTLQFTGDVSINGDITVLIDDGTNSIHSIPCDYCFYKLFSDCTGIKLVDDLFLSSITTLEQYCYSYMFLNCTSLRYAPKLPTTTLADGCYYSMFEDCTSLKYVPEELPATTLQPECYASMFYGCVSLTNAPDLPATTLADSCYHSMFEGCMSLIIIPEELPATTLADGCYIAMFRNCKSLTTAPKLPATTLIRECYYTMFDGCKSLIIAPELPATKLELSCYAFMFRNCSNLTQIKLYYKDIYDYLYFGSWWVLNVAETGTLYYNGSSTAQEFGFKNWVIVPF